MTVLELYEQFCKNYREEDYPALISLLQEHAALLAGGVVFVETEEQFNHSAALEYSKIFYIKETHLWHTINPRHAIPHVDGLFLRLLIFQAVISGDIDFLSKTHPNDFFSAKDDQIISMLFQLLSLDEIKALFPWAILNGTVNTVHALLKQILLKTNGIFKLDDPLSNGLTPLEILSKSDNDINTLFTKKMMLFYAASWYYFVAEQPTVHNIHHLPCSFSVDQPHANIKIFLDLQEETVKIKNDPSVQAVKAEDNPFFCGDGFCVGLNDLRNVYKSQGRDDYYLMTIALLNLWNGSAAQLDRPLPSILPQTLFYNTLGKLFAQWANDIMLFHGKNIDTLILKPQLSYSLREFSSQFTGRQASYFHLAKDSALLNTRLIMIENGAKLNFLRDLTQEQFEEYLSFFMKTRNIYTVISKNSHNTTCTLENDKKINHFDSSNRIVSSYLDSIADLREAIKKAHPEYDQVKKYQFFLAYRYDGPGHAKPWIKNSIFCEEELPQTGEATQAFQMNSPNRFTHLHVAVLVQDIETIKKILQQQKVDILAVDYYGRCAIDMAVENAFWEGVELLLADPRIDFFIFTQAMLDMLIIYEHEIFIIRLLQHQKVICCFDNGLNTVIELSLRYNKMKIIDDIKALFLQKENGSLFLLLKTVEILASRREKKEAQELFAWMAQHIDKEKLGLIVNSPLEYKAHHEKITLLHNAIIARNYIYAALLIANGANLNIPIQGGHNDGKTARQLLEAQGRLELIPEKERNLVQNIQVKAEKGFLFFSEATQRMEDYWQEKVITFTTARPF